MSRSTSASFTFSSDEVGVSFACRVDGGPFTACTSPHDLAGLADGSHTLELRATDRAGNTDASPASRTWTVDTVASETTILAGPSGIVAGATATFEFGASEAGSTFECRLDGGGYSACTSPQTYSNLAPGSHTFRVRATDRAGNTDPTRRNAHGGPSRPCSATASRPATSPAGALSRRAPTAPPSSGRT